ncbi:MAG: TldD/PmbA family protein [Candidatus Methanophagaceae archaeon]|nr:MAG: TldD/PmbA family protein [Methanophagales archaeon]
MLLFYFYKFCFVSIKMQEEIKKAVDFVISEGARFADIRLEKGYATTLELRDGVFREMSYGIDEGVGVRVLYKNSWGFSSSNELSKPRIKAAFEDALRVGRALSLSKSESEKLESEKSELEKKREEEAVKMAGAKPRSDHFKLKPKINPEDVSVEEKKRLVKAAYKAATQHSPLVKSVSILYLDGYEEKTYADSEGCFVVTEMPAVFLRVRVVAKKGSVLQEGVESVGAVAGFEVVAEEGEVAKGEAAEGVAAEGVAAEGVAAEGNPEVVGVKAADKAVRLLDAEQPPAGEFPVIMDSKLTGVFMHEALGHAAEADHVLCGESILKDKLGEQVAYEGLTVADDPTVVGSHGYYKYDDEGLRARRTEIIKNGVLVSYLHTRETAGRLEATPTANARAADYSEVPLVRMSNTVVEAGSRAGAGRGWSFEEMLEGVRFGIYAKGMRGGQVDTVRGEFQFSAEEAFLIEKGRLTKRLKNVSLSGRTLEVLKEIDAVGQEKKRGSIGFCGKDGQEVPVSEFAPHVRVKRILVGGAAAGGS